MSLKGLKYRDWRIMECNPRKETPETMFGPLSQITVVTGIIIKHQMKVLCDGKPPLILLCKIIS